MENRTSNTTKPSYSWVEEPNQRGTFGILSFCLSTMTICVWSTVHIDIPNTRHSSTRSYLYHALWTLITLIAPEFLLYLAINESIQAHTLEKIAAKYLRSRPMAEPGILGRGFNYILRRAKPYGVSTQQHTFNNISSSLNMHSRRHCGRIALASSMRFM
jgi:hypothetical protein